jgi:hypothetical protein
MFERCGASRTWEFSSPRSLITFDILFPYLSMNRSMHLLEEAMQFTN